MTAVSLRRFLRISPLIGLLVVATVASWVRLPYYSVGPGPAQEVEPLIHVDGPRVYASAGKLVMTTIAFRQVTAVLALITWLDPHRSIVDQDVLFPQGETPVQEQQRSLSEMDTSKLDAAYVVLQRTSDYPKEHGIGALIEAIQPGCPAEGQLYAGDLVTAIDGTPIRTVPQAQHELDAIPTDATATFTVQAAGETHQIPVTRGSCVPGHDPLFGISMIPDFPFRIRIESGDVGGPSAGLMWSLGLDDLLTPGDLAHGEVVAGTGTIDLEGHVGPIGGIGDKVFAAQSVGADVFLCPRGNLAGARAASDGSMRIVPVRTFQDALDALDAL